MARRPVGASVPLVVLVLTFLFTGCTPAPTTDQPRVAAPAPMADQPRVAAPAQASMSQKFHQALQEFQNQDIYFDFDQYDLRPEAQAILERKIAFLKEHGSVRVQIQGYCDRSGTSTYNLALGKHRAHAARQYLRAAGISAERLSIVSYGAERARDPEQPEGASAKHRRVHFVVLTP
jgi:peptidoglycan-associated lipoprotein